jgi:hypothetical protein
MLIFGVKPGFAGHFVEFGQNRQEKMGQKVCKNAQKCAEISGNLQKRARFEQKLTKIYHFLQINILLNWEV